jgi:uncharacterized membrane protein
MESKKRSIIKVITWQFVHLGFVAGIIYVFTREWEYASLGALAYLTWESIAYYFHERAWIKFGKNIK